MPAPVAAAAVPLLAKAGAFAKSMLLGKKALAGAKAAGLMGPALKGAKFGRFASQALGANKGEVAMRVIPDIGFGIMGGAMAPGDLGDKIIAGTTQAAGGILGGVGAGGAAKAMGMGSTGQLIADQLGSVAGDFASIPVADGLMRVKGGGTTPYEKQAAAADAAYRQQIEQELMAKYGLGGNPVLAANGLI